jgi:5-methylcytosine-specific restriction endonuclease McrA
VGDHVIAINKGGTDTVDNMVPSCGSCNSSKSDKILYKEWIPPKDRDGWSGWKAA